MAVVAPLTGAFVQADRARAQSLVATPGTSGDQLLFFYDATAGHPPYLVVSNLSPDALTLEVAWRVPGFSGSSGFPRVVLGPTRVVQLTNIQRESTSTGTSHFGAAQLPKLDVAGSIPIGGSLDKLVIWRAFLRVGRLPAASWWSG